MRMPLAPASMNKKALSERGICSKFITPALVAANWDLMTQIREEVSFTKSRVIVRGQLSTRGAPKRADYLLYLKLGIPLAVVEAICHPPSSSTTSNRSPTPSQ
jgi:type I restriction enzyme, R subunit